MVELYLYSTCGPYGLYKASVPVQGCTLPFLSISEHNEEKLWPITGAVETTDLNQNEVFRPDARHHYRTHSSRYHIYEHLTARLVRGCKRHGQTSSKVGTGKPRRKLKVRPEGLAGLTGGMIMSVVRMMCVQWQTCSLVITVLSA